MTAAEALAAIYVADANGRGIQTVFHIFDDWFRAGRFDLAEEAMRGVEMKRINANTALAFLTITAAARRELPGRPALVERVRALLSDLIGAEELEATLRGLT